MSRSFRATIIGWWLLPVHTVFSITLALSLLSYVQGRQFRVNREQQLDPSLHIRLSQPTVVAALSAALTVIRALAGSVVTIIGWRMAFIALAVQGPSLAQLDYMIAWRLPPLMGSIVLWIVFLLSLPSQFSSPVIQGAINWIPDVHYNEVESRGITTPGETIWWTWHNSNVDRRYYEIMRAVGLTALASSENFKSLGAQDAIPSIPSRRLVPSLLGIPTGSRLANISMPFFKAQSIQWARNASEIGDDLGVLLGVISNSTAPALHFGYTLNVFSAAGHQPGRMTLVNTQAWQPEPYSNGSYGWPLPTIHHQSSWLILGTFNGSNCSVPSDVFGPIDNIYKYSAYEGCFVFAKLNFTAGILRCKNCNITSPKVVEAAANYTAHEDILPDPMVRNAIAMIPEVLFYTTVANSTFAPTWQNLNGYALGLVATAYQASWNSLNNDFHQDKMDHTTLSVSIAVLRAQITVWRVWTWFGLNLSLTAAGLVLGLHQWILNIKVAQNPALASLLIDPSAIFQRHPARFNDINDLTKKDLRVAVRLDHLPQQPRLVSADTTVRRRLYRREHSSSAYKRGPDDSSQLELVPKTSSESQGLLKSPGLVNTPALSISRTSSFTHNSGPLRSSASSVFL